MSELKNLDFQVAFGAVRHFGRNLYTTNPPAIAELVANAWDAYAKSCKIYYNASAMLIVDSGIGMTDDEFQNRYATSGNEKNTDVRMPDNMKLRPYMGKKGIGKFSAFSLADEYELYTKSSNDEVWKHIKLDQSILTIQEPTISIPIERTNDLTELSRNFDCDLSNYETGTIIYLPRLKRIVTSATLNALSKLLSHRFSITTIINDGNFDVIIKTPEEELPVDFKEHFYYNDIEYLHYFGYNATDISTKFKNLTQEYLVKEADYDKDIKGWIGSVNIPSTLILEEDTALKGVSVYINGKLVDEDILKSIKKDRISDSYIVGEIDANYLGNLSDDVVLSSREGLFLDNEDVAKLKAYIEGIRKNLVAKWDEMRRGRPLDKQDYLQKLISKPENKTYYDLLGKEEQTRFNKYAQKLFDKPKSNCDDNVEKLNNLMFSALMQIVNNESIQKLLNGEIVDEREILECFSKLFNLTEINHALRLRDGVRNNLSIIKELEKYIASGEVEKVFERHLAKNPWLIEPTWIAKVKSVHTQDYYTVLNIDNNDTKKLYTDIVVEVSDEQYPIIVEIKREKATGYSTPDVNSICNQLYNYKKVMAEKLTKELGCLVAADSIITYFICGSIAFDKIDSNDRDRLRREQINLRSYDELIRTSKRIFEVNFGEDVEDTFNV